MVGVTVLANALWAALLMPDVLVVAQRGVIDREERLCVNQVHLRAIIGSVDWLVKEPLGSARVTPS